MSDRARTFVLVHGAWHGGWCWREVARTLRDAGHAVFTPTLTGMGERLHLARADTGMSTHAADILGVIEAEELGDVVLVAHSYAGHPASYAAAALPGRVRRLVYLDALLPHPGRSMIDGADPAMAAATRAMLIDGVLLPSWPAEMFGVPRDHPNHEWAQRRLTPLPIGCLEEIHPPLPDAFDRLDRIFVRCTANHLPDSSLAAQTARTMGLPVVDLDAGHDAMITAPEATADLLLGLAR